MSTEIQQYLFELSRVDERKRVDEAIGLAFGAAAMAAPWILRFFGPTLAKRGLQWGAPALRKTLPRMMGNFIKKYPETAAKIGLNNKEVQKILMRASIKSGQGLEKLANAGIRKNPKLAMLRYGGGALAGDAAADALSDNDDDEAPSTSGSSFSPSSGADEAEFKSFLKKNNFDSRSADKLIERLRKNNYFTPQMRSRLQNVVDEITNYPGSYLEFAKSL